MSPAPLSAAPARDRGRLQGLAMLAITACSWGFNWPVSKFLLGELPPFAMRTLCCGGGAVFAFALAAGRGEPLRPPAGQWPRLIAFAAMNYGAFTILTTLALFWLPASQAVIVTYTLPIWAAVLAWPMLGERPTPARILATALGLAGVALLVTGQPQATAAAAGPAWTRPAGFACGLAAAFVFGLGTVIAKRAPLRMPPIAGVAWQATLGTLPVVALAAFEPVRLAAVTPLGWGAIAYVAVLPMSLAYLAWFRALRLLPANTAATGVLLAPAIGVFASALMLHEALGWHQLAALALTLAGVALAARG